jgi:cytochrome bd-type quinol oxidase subunit 1
MSENPYEPEQPPVDLDVDLLAEPPGWPKIVGIVSIVFGALGLTCGGCGLLGQGMQSFIPEMEGVAQQPQVMAPILTYSLMVIALLVSILLLIAGIMTLLRNPVGRPLHLLYAVLKILVVIVGLVVFIMIWPDYKEELGRYFEESGQNAQTRDMMLSGTFYGVLFQNLIFLAYPVFCLIWFGLIKRKPEDMTMGMEEPAA